MFDTINWKIEHQIGYLMLDRPPANIMTKAFFGELSRFTTAVLPSASIKAMIIYGNGRHFSSGADHVELTSHIRRNIPDGRKDYLPDFLLENTESFQYIAQLNIPTIAAIRGTCLGSALELALACKIRLCGEGAVLGFPETTFGLMPGCGGTVHLTSLAGKSRAIELILSGRIFSAQEALQWGIVHRILPRKSVIEEAVKLAGRVGGS